MFGDDPKTAAQNLRQDFAKEYAMRAQAAYDEAMEDTEATPEFAAAQLKAERMGQGGDITPEQAKVNEVKAEYDWRADPDEVGEFNARVAQDLKFARLVKGDIRNASVFERAAHWLAGDDGEARTVGEAARNSLARGLYSLPNLFSNTPALREDAERLSWLRDAQKAVDEGREAEFFGTKEDPTGAIGAASFKLNGKAEMADLEARIKDLAKAQSRLVQIQGMYPQSKEMEQFGKVKGFGEAFSFIAQNPIDFLANMGPEMGVQMAPMIMGAAVGAAVSPVATLGLMGAQGAFSYGIDKNSGMLEMMADAGIDTTDPEAVAAFFMDSRAPLYRKIDQESSAHAAPVAVMDALSVVAGMARAPMKLGEKAHAVAPKFTRGYESMMAAPMAYHGINYAGQAIAQSALGAGGEALGQIAARGEIYDHSAVVAEIAGEHFTAPIEMLNAARAARADGLILAARNENMQKHLTEVHEAAQQSTSLALDPQSHKEVIQNATETETTAEGEPLWQTVPFSPDAMTDEEKQVLAQVSPAFAEALAKAERDGSQAEISYADFVTQIAPNEAAPAFIKAAHVPFEMSNGEIEMLAQNQIEEATRSVAESTQSEFRASLKKVGQEIASMLEAVPEPNREAGTTGTMLKAEKKAAVSLITAHVSAMAKDSGLTPEEVWKQYGLKGVVPGMDVKSPDGKPIGGAYVPSAREIYLTLKSNKSTFLHETGHWFLGARLQLAQALKAGADLTEEQKRFVDLTEKTVEWLTGGKKTMEEFATMSVDERRAMEEKFARTYEAYLYEGKAPTNGLRGVFHKFSMWLRTVYASLSAIPEAEISDDVRELFDGLFVASEQAREAILRRGIYKATASYLAGNADDQPIIDALKQAYADLEDEVREKLMERYFRDARRYAQMRANKIKSLTNEGKRILKQLKDETRERLLQEKDQAAYATLKNGIDITVNAGEKQVRTHVRLRIPAEKKRRVGGIDLYVPFNEFPAYNESAHTDYFNIDGQALAEKLGFTSEDEMVKALEAREDLETAVDREATERFMNEYGEFSSRERIVEAADQAIYGPAMEMVLSRELKLMEKATGSRPATVALFKPVVEAVLGRVKLKDLKPRAYRADATRAANKAMDFLTGRRKDSNGNPVKHDTIAAAREKRRQLFHSLKAERAQKLRTEFAKRINHLRSYAAVNKPEIARTDTEYYEQVQALCVAYGFIQGEVKYDVRQSFDKFKAAQEAKGIPIQDLPPIPPGGYADLTVNELDMVLKGIEQLAGISRELMRIRAEEEKIRIEQAQAECAQSIVDAAVDRGLKPILSQRGEGQQSKTETAVRKFFMSHRRIPSLLQCMEGTQFGKLWEYIVKPFDAAGAREETMRAELSKKAAEILKPLRTLTRNHKRVFRPYLDGSFTDAEIVAIALNMNSEENLARLIAGSERYKGRGGRGQWTEEAIIKEVQSVLNKEQLDAIQQFWDLCGSLWPQVVELEHRTYHRAPVPVKPKETTFTLPNGEQVTLQGGYYPIRYDKNVSNSAVGIDSDHEDALSTMTARSLSPDKTHTMERAAGVPPGRAVELTLTAGFSGLDSVVHDLCWREELANATKLFDPQGELSRTIKEYWGAEALDAIDRWRKDIAMGDNKQGNQLDVMANALRSNISLAGIGFNLVTAAVQLTGFTQSIVALGPRWAGVGISEFMKNPKAMHKLCQQKSAVMASRARTQFRELAEAHSMMSGTTGPVRERIMRYAYMPIVAVQTAVDVPTWLGAYNHALADGCSEAEAVARADRTLIDSQGSGRLQDLSGVERGGPWQKLFTVFYTFFNTTYNLALVKGQTERGMKRALNLITLLAVQPVLEGFLREALKIGGDDDDDDFKYLKNAGKSVVSFNMGLLMGVRELSGIVDGFGYRGPTGLRKLTDLDKLATQVKQGEFDEGLLKAMVNVTGDWAGIPVVPFNRAISGVNALANDETDNWLAPFLGYSKY